MATPVDFCLDREEQFRDPLRLVDPYEATANVNALLTQIETAYALTARLQNLSLVNFI